MPDQGPSRSECFISLRDYHAFQGGTTHTSYGVSHGSNPQALQSSSLQSGTPTGYYDTAPHASQQAPGPMGPRPPTVFIPMDSIQSADPSYPLGFVRQQNPEEMTLAGPSSQGSAGAWGLLTRSSSYQSASESHSPYNPGGFRVVLQQSPRPVAAAPPSQCPAGAQDTWIPFSQVYLDFTFSRQPLPEVNWTAMAAAKRKALVVCSD
jgi:hypothetical protein